MRIVFNTYTSTGALVVIANGYYVQFTSGDDNPNTAYDYDKAPSDMPEELRKCWAEDTVVWPRRSV